MNPLYALRQWRYETGKRASTPTVANHRSVQRRAAVRAAREQRTLRRIEQAAAARAWVAAHLGPLPALWRRASTWTLANLDRIGSHLAVAWLALTAAYFLSVQPVLDAAEEQRIAAEHRTTEAKREADQWRGIAQASASRSLTLNITGNEHEVKNVVRRIAELESKQ